MEGEEARVPRKVRDPAAPSRAEWLAHQATHLPFRAWCAHCVAGRSDNPPRRRCAAAEEEGAVPEVHFDYTRFSSRLLN